MVKKARLERAGLNLKIGSPGGPTGNTIFTLPVFTNKKKKTFHTGMHHCSRNNK
jgi:hypothetical protein